MTMGLELNDKLNASAADEDDLRNTKHALNRLGYYTPEYAGGVTGMTDGKLFDAIRRFQSDHKLKATGALNPDDDTVNAINRAIKDQPIAAEYIWRTAGDDKVRSEHAAREGKRFTWIQHPVPGEDYQCRCWAEPVVGKQTVDQIYDPPIKRMPDWEIEVLKASLFGKAAIGSAKVLRAIEWATKNTVSDATIPWHLGPHKNYIAWVNRLQKGDWFTGGVRQSIDKVLREGEQFKASNKVNKDNTATRYQLNDKFVVRDDKTEAILQVSRKGIKPEELP